MFFRTKFSLRINSYYNLQIVLITNFIKQAYTYKFTDMKNENKTK